MKNKLPTDNYKSFEDLFEAVAKSKHWTFRNKIAKLNNKIRRNFEFNNWLNAIKGIGIEESVNYLTERMFNEYLEYEKDPLPELINKAIELKYLAVDKSDKQPQVEEISKDMHAMNFRQWLNETFEWQAGEKSKYNKLCTIDSFKRFLEDEQDKKLSEQEQAAKQSEIIQVAFRKGNGPEKRELELNGKALKTNIGKKQKENNFSHKQIAIAYYAMQIQITTKNVMKF